MSMRRHELPILEFDDDMRAVIEPDHDKLGVCLPPKAAFVFLDDRTIDRCAAAHSAVVAAHFESITKRYPIYVLTHEGEEICLAQAPVGAAAAAQILDWLIAYGARAIVSGGSCGVLTPRAENAFLIPRRALRDEGASYHYAAPSRFMEIDPTARAAIAAALEARGLPWAEVVTWSTDGFFRETAERVRRRREEGCEVVEMECAALAAVAAARGAVWGELLYTADSLADTARYDTRGWGADSMERALTLCLDAARRL